MVHTVSVLRLEEGKYEKNISLSSMEFPRTKQAKSHENDDCYFIVFLNYSLSADIISIPKVKNIDI